MSRFTQGFERQYSRSSSSSSSSSKFDVNKLGSGGKLSSGDMANLRNLLAEKTSHGHQKQAINLRKTQMAARNVITPPWGANRSSLTQKTEYKTPGVGKQGVTKVVVGQARRHYSGGGPDISYVAKRRPGELIQKENQDYKERLAMRPKVSFPSYKPDMKKRLQEDYVNNLRVISTVPNACIKHGDVSVEDMAVSGKKRFEEPAPNIVLYDPLPAESNYVPPEMLASYNKQLDNRRPYV